MKRNKADLVQGAIISFILILLIAAIVFIAINNLFKSSLKTEIKFPKDSSKSLEKRCKSDSDCPENMECKEKICVKKSS